MATAQILLQADRLNRDCHCITLDRRRLAERLNEAVGDPSFSAAIEASHPGLVSRQPVFLSIDHARRIESAVAAIEAVVRLPSYRGAVLSHSPEIAIPDPGPVGVFMGYDFHLTAEGPKLIEINTNAGGALINAYIGAAHIACCREMEFVMRPREALSDVVERFVASFRAEWARQGRGTPLEAITIVDEAPHTQYLYPEFLLFQRLFEAAGLRAHIAAPHELQYRDRQLWRGADPIDLVYNRLTDFMLEGPDCAALAAAYRDGTVVLTPNPHVHALLANKGNLVLLSDPDALHRLGADANHTKELQRVVPRTLTVIASNAEELWSARSRYFFKPLAGHAGKGAYRGDKLTKRVWAEITKGGYIAQELVVPSSRTVLLDGVAVSLKVDVRAYTYDGEVQLMAARLYQGQTTNFRTPGGGFAPVFFADFEVSCTCD